MTADGPAYLRFRILPDMTADQVKEVRKAKRDAEKAERQAADAAMRHRQRLERVVSMREACKSAHRLAELCEVCTTRCRRDMAADDERVRKERKRKARLASEIGRNPDIAATPTTLGVIVDADGDKAHVQVAEASPMGIAGRLGLPAQHKAAVERLQRDYEVSTWNARAASFEMGVDGSRNPANLAHLHVIEAHTRLKDAARCVGRDWPLIQATMLPPYMALSSICRKARVDYREARDRLGLALDALADFYTPGQIRPDPVLRICAEVVQKAAREVG